jgi:hypothetical protein
MNIVKRTLTAGYIAIGSKLDSGNVEKLRTMNVMCETYVNDLRLPSSLSDPVEHAKIHAGLMRVMANMSRLQTEEMILVMSCLAHGNPAFIASIITCGMEVTPIDSDVDTMGASSSPNPEIIIGPTGSLGGDDFMLEYVLLAVGMIMTDAIVPLAAVSPLLSSAAAEAAAVGKKRWANLDEVVTAAFRDLPPPSPPYWSSALSCASSSSSASMDPPFLPVFAVRGA